MNVKRMIEERSLKEDMKRTMIKRCEWEEEFSEGEDIERVYNY
jgi:hypothetical protein